jgi:cytochrome c553
VRSSIPIVVGVTCLIIGVAVLFTAPSSPPVPTATAHFDEFDRLVLAATTGDVPLAGIVARDLTAGPEAEGIDEEIEATLGGALGFLPFAEDAEELSLATARAAQACGSCHERMKVLSPPRPPWTHETAGRWIAWGLVWSDRRSPPENEPPLSVTAEWARPLPADTGSAVSTTRTETTRRAARAWTTCAGCHLHQTDLPAQE